MWLVLPFLAYLSDPIHHLVTSPSVALDIKESTCPLIHFCRSFFSLQLLYLALIAAPFLSLAVPFSTELKREQQVQCYVFIASTGDKKKQMKEKKCQNAKICLLVPQKATVSPSKTTIWHCNCFRANGP
jgi:hypothetical protein